MLDILPTQKDAVQNPGRFRVMSRRWMGGPVIVLGWGVSHGPGKVGLTISDLR
jgi:hypothetical protein